MINFRVVYRPDLIPDGRPRIFSPGETVNGELVTGDGWLVLVDQAQLLDVMRHVNADEPEPVAHVTMTRNLDPARRHNRR